MPSVGSAYVNIRVNTKSFSTSLEGVMARLSKQMEAQGAKLGKDFERGMKKSNFDAAFKPLTDASGKAKTKLDSDFKSMGDSANKAGEAIHDAMDGAAMGFDTVRDESASTRKEFVELGKSAKSADREVSRMGRGGGGGGSGLRAAGGAAGFFSSQLDDIASRVPRAQKLLAGLYNTAAFGGTALAGAVSGLSAVGQGIFVVGANAAAAAPAMAVFSSGLLGLAQVGGALGIAMKGVGDAISAGFKSVAPAVAPAAAATKGLGDATASAARAVRDAKDALQDAYRDAARAAEDAARRTLRAEQELADAQRETIIVQRSLNAARKEGMEQLEDIAFAAEDAALAERRAGLDLQDAYAALQEVSELPADSRARQEAQLAFEEAELNLRQAKDAREDANRDQKAAAKSGVEGTDAMIDAREALADAQEREAEAARALNDARREEAEQAVDSADRIAEAQQAVADAQRAMGDAQKAAAAGTAASTTAVDNYAEALAKLAPEQRRFVERIIGMKDEFQKARNQIATPIFEGLNTALTDITRGGLFDIIVDGLTGTSEAMKDVIVDAGALSRDPVFQGSLADTMKTNNRSMRNFGQAGVYLADAFVQVADAAAPLLEDFSQWTEEVTKSWSETTRLKNKTGELGDTINTAGDRVSEFWELGKQLWRTLKLLGSAANDAANGFAFIDEEGRKQKGYIPSLTDNLKQFNDALDQPGKKREMIEGFTQALNNMNAAGGALKTAIIDPLVSMGQDPNVAKAFDTISKSDAFDRLADTAGDALPELAEIAVNIADILADLSESGSIDAFLGALEKVSGAVKTIVDLLFSIPGMKTGIGLAGGALGIYRAFKLTMGLFKTAVAGTIGDVRGIGNRIKGFFSTKGGLGAKIAGAKAAGSATEEIGESAWEKEVLILLGAIERAVLRCCAAMGGMAGKAAGAAGGAAMASSAGGLGVGAAAAGEAGKVGKFAGMMGKFSKILGPATKLLKPLSFGIRALGFAFRFMMGPFGLILFTLLPLLWPLLVKLEEKTGIFSKSLEALTDAFQWMWDKVQPILESFVDALGWFWDKVKEGFDWVKSNWPLLLGILTGPIGLAVVLIIKYWDEILAFVKGVPGKIKGFLKGVWNIFSEGLRTVWGRVQEIWGRIVNWVKGRPAQFKANLRLLWDMFKTGLSNAWSAVQSIWSRVVTWVKGRPDQFKTNLKALWDIFKDGLGDAWDWVVGKWDKIKTAIAKWPGQIGKGLKKIWDGMGEGLIDAINWVGNKVEWLVGKINDITGKFGGPEIKVSFPEYTWAGFAGGGPVRGRGGPRGDKIPARLSDGEHVLTAAEVRAMGGHKNVASLRKSALRGELPEGGLWGAIVSGAKNIGSAIGKGASYAIKWVIGKFVDMMPDTFIGNFVGSMMENAANKFAGWGKKKDEEAQAAASGTSVGAYKGPPGGWTYPLARHFSAYTFSGHNPSWAVDIGASGGTPVRAASAGKVISVIDLGSTSYGKYIKLSHAGGIQTLYAHLSKFGVKPGDIVKTGQLIGYSGNTGGVRGSGGGYHLHFELMPSSSTIAAMAMRGVRLGKGGVVAPSAGGTMAVLAEAGQHERVTPLDPEGFTPAERRIIETLEAKLGGGGDQYHVHPSEKMDETRLADLVARRVKWQKRRGAGRR